MAISRNSFYLLHNKWNSFPEKNKIIFHENVFFPKYLDVVIYGKNAKKCIPETKFVRKTVPILAYLFYFSDNFFQIAQK